jgi:hypothetical protein
LEKPVDPLKNPYTPGAGTRPRALTGRDAELSRAQYLFDRIISGYSEKSMLIIGLRGVGKTVLLNTFADFAEQKGFQTAHVEAAEVSDFRATMVRVFRKVLLGISPWNRAKDRLKRALGVLRAFSVKTSEGVELGVDVEVLTGLADSGDISEDLSDLFVEVGEAAKAHSMAIALFFDELQYIKREAFGSLISAMHRVSQKSLPITMVGAGLPQLPALAGNAKSYAERLFDFPEIGSLDFEAAEEALVSPAKDLGVCFSEDAVEELYFLTEGYPYFLQEYGKHVWNLTEGDSISLDDVRKATAAVQQHLDTSFFRVRVDRATPAEKRYMRAMAELDAGPYPSGKIAEKLGTEVTSVGPIRAKLISKGFIYSPNHGQNAFTVPQFDKFLRRNFPFEKSE